MPYFGFYGIDMYYIVLVLPCIVLAMWAQMRVKSTFNQYSRVRNVRGVTGAQAAAAVLRQNGVGDVRIERVAGNLTDHYDPRANVIRLSDSVYDSISVASVGVAAHEAGHAVQYATGYMPIRLRAAIVPITQIGSGAALPLILLGLFMNSGILIDIGIIAFALATVFQLVTLPVELNASNRALAAIEQGGLLTADEYPMAKKTLWAAAMTYVAALAVSLAQLLRLLLLFGGRGRDDR
ncbi:zinc metallopeptidase [Butyricicoccus faecihominis]|uniref:zinc metallopeptidase n=1 Tax=Butyricicoccaceae TaxID=3085642 RepID=UPI0024787C16|nr:MULTISPECIES: zinc metallopeptidase [Butyricicoccaceae]MCQ5129676.1 zinc metallopeptidase [Butyricicoccus faecihominis]WNX85389.1 zinc metallopeptidase [Agathobaculum sp. NTUH-O15-33]